MGGDPVEAMEDLTEAMVVVEALQTADSDRIAMLVLPLGSTTMDSTTLTTLDPVEGMEAPVGVLPTAGLARIAMLVPLAPLATKAWVVSSREGRQPRSLSTLESKNLKQCCSNK